MTDAEGETLAASSRAASKSGAASDHSAQFAKGTFANAGDFTVAVTRAIASVEASA